MAHPSRLAFPGTLPISAGDPSAYGTREHLERLLTAVEDLGMILAQLTGPKTGVIQYLFQGVGVAAREDSMKVTARGTPSMGIIVGSGAAQVHGLIPRVFRTGWQSATNAFTAPVGNPRIDVVQFSVVSGLISILTGTPAASPSAPATSANCVKLAEIYLRVGSTAIYNTDKGSNAYIIDRREFTNA